jgi:hypothetical protein
MFKKAIVFMVSPFHDSLRFANHELDHVAANVTAFFILYWFPRVITLC